MNLSAAEKAGLAAGALLYLLACNATPLGHYVDDLVWVLLSDSFLRGSVQAAWSWFPKVETSATWGFPALLAPAVALAGFNALALKAACAAMLAGGTALFYVSWRERVAPEARPAFLAGLFGCGFTLSFSGAVMSEAGYLLLFGLACFLALRRGWLERRPAAFGALCGALVLTRAIGASFALAALAELALARRRKELIRFMAAAAAVAAPYFIISKLASGTFTFHSAGWVLAGALKVPALNAYYYLKGLCLLSFVYFPAFMPNLPWLKIPALLAVAATAVWGARLLAREPGGRLLALYAAAYFAVCLNWPFQGPRFVVPVYPVFLLWLVAGFSSLVRARSLAPASAALAGLILLSNAGEIRASLAKSFSQPPDVPHQSHLWLRDHSAEGDLIVSMDIARVRYYAGRRGVHFIPSSSAEDFAARARELGAKFFFLKDAGYVPATLGGTDPVAAQHARLAEYVGRADLFSLVHENREEGVRIYRLR